MKPHPIERFLTRFPFTGHRVAPSFSRSGSDGGRGSSGKFVGVVNVRGVPVS